MPSKALYLSVRSVDWSGCEEQKACREREEIKPQVQLTGPESELREDEPKGKEIQNGHHLPTHTIGCLRQGTAPHTALHQAGPPPSTIN